MIVVNFFDLMEKQAKSLEEFNKFTKQAYKLIRQARKTHELLKDTPFEAHYKEIIKDGLESVAHLLEDLDRPKGKRVNLLKDLDKPKSEDRNKVEDPESKVGSCGSFPDCYYCEVPVQFRQKTTMKTYDGDTCEIYSDYSDIRYEYKTSSASFTLEEITLRCRTSFMEKYPDVPDFDETIKEMLIDIDLDDLWIVCKVGDNLFQSV